MNRLNTQKQGQILQMLTEGNSLRATSRMADVAYNTVLKMVSEAGAACAEYQDKVFQNLTCKKLQVDEIWAFVYAKAKNVPENKKGAAGDCWTWIALDADTKLVPSWMIGNRDVECAKAFMQDVKERLANRVQLTSDGLKAYLTAVDQDFGEDVDFAQLVKIYGETIDGQKRYSPAECVGTKKTKIVGNPDLCCVSTSYIERQNLTLRMQSRRFTRLTNAFSKKIENHAHGVALHFMNYNFARIHKTLRVTPAMAAGISDHVWTFEEIANLMGGKNA